MPKRFKTVTIPERIYLLALECVENRIANSISEVVSEAVERYANVELEKKKKEREEELAKEFSEFMKSLGHEPPLCPKCGRALTLMRLKMQEHAFEWKCAGCGFQTRTSAKET